MVLAEGHRHVLTAVHLNETIASGEESLDSKDPTILAPRLPVFGDDDRDDVRLQPRGEWANRTVRGEVIGQEGAGLTIRGCRVVGLRLTAAILERAQIMDTVFEGCDLSAALLAQASLTRVQFTSCRMLASVASEAILRDVLFVDCDLDAASLRMTEAERVGFDHCDLSNADFYGAHLVHSRFFDCTLRAVEFSQSSLQGARLHGSVLADLKGAAALRGVVIDSAQIVPMALQVFAALGLLVDDEREPKAKPRKQGGRSSGGRSPLGRP